MKSRPGTAFNEGNTYDSISNGIIEHKGQIKMNAHDGCAFKPGLLNLPGNTRKQCIARTLFGNDQCLYRRNFVAAKHIRIHAASSNPAINIKMVSTCAFCLPGRFKNLLSRCVIRQKFHHRRTSQPVINPGKAVGRVREVLRKHDFPFGALPDGYHGFDFCPLFST